MEPMEPREVAELVFDRVVDYCNNKSGDTPLDCMADHSPDQLDVFIDSYLDEEEIEEIDNALENPETTYDDVEKEYEKIKTFYDDVEKEYEKLWKEWMAEEIAYDLGHLEIEDLAYNIANNYELSNSCKVARLKAYVEALREFAGAIKLALQEKEPLSSSKLYEWFERLAEFVPSDKSEFIKGVDYYLDFYNIYEVDELLTLDLLSQYVDRAIRKIETEYLPELEALTNTS